MKTLKQATPKKTSIPKKERGKKGQSNKVTSGNKRLDDAIKNLFKPK